MPTASKPKSKPKKSPKTPSKKPAKTAAPRKADMPRSRALKPGADGVVRLSGGNPQIAKGYGDAPVQTYIAAMPGWKKAVGQRIDAIITDNVPGVRKAVKWNSPMYGVEDDHYFLSLHVFDRYVKVAFFRGTDLRPLPPGESKQKFVRYLDVPQTGLDEAQFATWVKQAAELPGQKM